LEERERERERKTREGGVWTPGVDGGRRRRVERERERVEGDSEGRGRVEREERETQRGNWPRRREKTGLKVGCTVVRLRTVDSACPVFLFAVHN